MDFKALIITALSFTSICSASMPHEEKFVNKSMLVDLADIDFRAEGMFLGKDSLYEIRLSNLVNDGTDYFAFYKIDYVCGNCRTIYKTNPGTCTVCGSSDIREREIDLWPVGSITLIQIENHDGKG